MATLQSSYFLKNGSAEWGNCQITNTDRLECEAIFTSSSSEIGRRAFITWVVRNASNIDQSLDSGDLTATQTIVALSPRITLNSTKYTIIYTRITFL